MKTLALLLILADVVYLKSGGRIEGKVVDKGDTYVVEHELGSATLKKADVDRVEKKEWAAKGLKMPEKRRASLPESFSHPFLAFKIYLPTKWGRGPNHGKSHASFYGPKDVVFVPRIDLTVERSTTELPDYVAKYKETFSKVYPDLKYVGDEDTKVRGNAAHQFSAVFKDADVPYQVLWTFVASGDRRYVLSFACTLGWFEKYYALADGTVRTLKVYSEPALSKDQKAEFAKFYDGGLDAYKKQDYKTALDQFKKAAAILPDYPEIHLLVAQACLRQKNFKDAETAYKKAMDADKEDAGAAYNLGVCLLQQSKYDGAIEALSKAVELAPDHEPAATNLGVAFLASDKADRARKILETAIALDPDSAPAHYNLGLACEKLNDAKAAEKEFKEALRIDANHQGAKDGLKRLKK